MEALRTLEKASRSSVPNAATSRCFRVASCTIIGADMDSDGVSCKLGPLVTKLARLCGLERCHLNLVDDQFKFTHWLQV